MPAAASLYDGSTNSWGTSDTLLAQKLNSIQQVTEVTTSPVSNFGSSNQEAAIRTVKSGHGMALLILVFNKVANGVGSGVMNGTVVPGYSVGSNNCEAWVITMQGLSTSEWGVRNPGTYAEIGPYSNGRSCNPNNFSPTRIDQYGTSPSFLSDLAHQSYQVAGAITAFLIFYLGSFLFFTWRHRRVKSGVEKKKWYFLFPATLVLSALATIPMVILLRPLPLVSNGPGPPFLGSYVFNDAYNQNNGSWGNSVQTLIAKETSPFHEYVAGYADSSHISIYIPKNSKGQVLEASALDLASGKCVVLLEVKRDVNQIFWGQSGPGTYVGTAASQFMSCNSSEIINPSLSPNSSGIYYDLRSYDWPPSRWLAVEMGAPLELWALAWFSIFFQKWTPKVLKRSASTV
ncbi:MAG: hypothetical protein HKL80_01550 [Acidimicrobiales bacterium]|nr:hypothetical protein [Acidimicrobiales bacterium]